MGSLPQFLTESGEPVMSTSEYWRRYTFLLLMGPKKIQIDELITKAGPLEAAEDLQMKIAKATFITVIGDKTVKVMQNRQPKEMILDKELSWIKDLWEKIWNSENNQNHQLIQLLTAKRDSSESIFDFWNKLAKLATECRLDNKTATEIMNALVVAVFTIAVDDEEIVKTVWEKTLTHDQLSEHISKTHRTNRILSKVIPDRPNSREPKVKQEPIGRIKDRKHRESGEKAKKDGFRKGVSIRCGDKWTKTHMEKCPAKAKRGNICKKEGHIAKMCKSDQKKTHIRRVEEDESSDSEEMETEQSDSDSESQTSSEVNTSVDSFDDNQMTYQKTRQGEEEKPNIQCQTAMFNRIKAINRKANGGQAEKQ